MLALFAFIITIIGCLNWLCIGFFQFDFVAGLFGTQSSIFSRLIYIIIGIASVFLTYAVIRYKGRLTIKKNRNQDKVLTNQAPAPDNLQNNNLFTNNQTNLNPTSINSQQNSNINNVNTINSNKNNLNNQNNNTNINNNNHNPNQNNV